MEAKVYKLSFSGAVHFGAGRLSGGGCAFDASTLFSALFMEALDDGSSRGLLQAAQSGDLFLSDAFPFIGDELYLPKPMLAPQQVEGSAGRVDKGDSREKKAFKKLGYIPASEYTDFCHGEDFDALTHLQRFELGKKGLRTNVNLERADVDAEPFAVGSYSFAPGAGLYFIAAGPYDIAPLMERLQYSGLGGRRNAGYGRFSFQQGACPIGLGALSDVGAVNVLLSTALPAAGELDDELLSNARYSLARKGGFAQTRCEAAAGKRKRVTFPFKAGSVFEKTFEGVVLDVAAPGSPHPVYRYGRALWMGV